MAGFSSLSMGGARAVLRFGMGAILIACPLSWCATTQDDWVFLYSYSSTVHYNGASVSAVVLV
jgi:hypothetical protein